jgi:CheY-like chemotaxis protein
MDLQVPDMTGLEAITAIRGEFPTRASNVYRAQAL